VDHTAHSLARPPAPIKTRLTLRPGDNGTKKLVQKYGHRLLAVRYRYDAAARRRIKTVELLEEELPWDPTPIPPANSAALRLVRIAYHETELRDRAKAAGARWQPDRKLWCMTHAAVLALGLEARAVE
jgi:hypothetical protein